MEPVGTAIGSDSHRCFDIPISEMDETPRQSESQLTGRISIAHTVLPESA